MTDLKIDKSCVPYPRKGLYWIINLPYLGLLILTTVYLWSFDVLIASIYISFYLLSTILHGYVCAFSDCPYTGTFCQGAFAWFPVEKIAQLVQRLKVKKSHPLINAFFLVIMLSLIGILVLPVYWISKLGIIYSIGYLTVIFSYFFSFILAICPKCANRLNCPTAKLSNLLHKKIYNEDILKFD